MRREIDTKKTTENPPAQNGRRNRTGAAASTCLTRSTAPGYGTAIPRLPPSLRPFLPFTPGMAMSSPPPPFPSPPVVPGVPTYAHDPRYKHCTVTHPCWIGREGRITQWEDLVMLAEGYAKLGQGDEAVGRKMAVPGLYGCQHQPWPLC